MKKIYPVPKFVYVKTHVMHKPFIWLEVQIIWLIFLLKAILKQTLMQIYSS